MKLLAIVLTLLLTTTANAQRIFHASDLVLVNERIDDLTTRIERLESQRRPAPATPKVLLAAYTEPAAKTRVVKICGAGGCRYVTVPVKQTAIYKGRSFTGRVCNSPTCRMCNSISDQLGTARPSGTSRRGWRPGKWLFGR